MSLLGPSKSCDRSPVVMAAILFIWLLIKKMYYSLLHFTFKSIELAVFAEDCNCNMYYVYMFARNKSKQIKLSEIPDPLIKTLFFFF